MVILGSSGQVGFELTRELAMNAKLYALARDARFCLGTDPLDLTELDALAMRLREWRPGAVFNAAAYTAVDRAESEPELATTLNGELPAKLAELSVELGFQLVHISTDYVFEGSASNPYREEDQTHPQCTYGHSKALGEQAILGSAAQALVARTSWVHAARGKNFLLTMLRLACERDSLQVVVDQRGRPTWARWLALTLVRLWRDGIADSPSLLHVVPAGETSWHGFAQHLLTEARSLGLIERLPTIDAIASEEFPTPAPRPPYSVLCNQRLRERLGNDLPDWRDLTRLCLQELVENP